MHAGCVVLQEVDAVVQLAHRWLSWHIDSGSEACDSAQATAGIADSQEGELTPSCSSAMAAHSLSQLTRE